MSLIATNLKPGAKLEPVPFMPRRIRLRATPTSKSALLGLKGPYRFSERTKAALAASKPHSGLLGSPR